MRTVMLTLCLAILGADAPTGKFEYDPVYVPGVGDEAKLYDLFDPPGTTLLGATLDDYNDCLVNSVYEGTRKKALRSGRWFEARIGTPVKVLNMAAPQSPTVFGTVSDRRVFYVELAGGKRGFIGEWYVKRPRK